MTPRRILHVASSFGGGAGTAARRIVEAQRIAGLDSQLVALTGGDMKLMPFETPLPTGPIRKLKSKAITVLQSNLIQNSDNLMTPVSLSATSQIKNLMKDFDIINVHATYNLISFRGMRNISRSLPMVVTLHDQRFFTGGCHYSFDCRGYKMSCEKCPQTRRIFQVLPMNELGAASRYLADFGPISFVSPSKWLANLASSSRLLQHSRISVIPNPIPANPANWRAESDKEPVDYVLKVGFISKNLDNPYKGLETLLRAVEHIARRRAIQLQLFGAGKVPSTSGLFEVVRTEFLSDYDRVTAIASCDVVVVPSKQDNFPSVIGECLVVGVPVIATNVGGIPEIMKEFRMPMFEPGDWEGLAELLLEQTKSRLNSADIARANLKFSPIECGKQYLKKYESIMDVV